MQTGGAKLQNYFSLSREVTRIFLLLLLLLFFFRPTGGHCSRGDPLIVWNNMIHTGNIPLTLSRAQPGSSFFRIFLECFPAFGTSNRPGRKSGVCLKLGKHLSRGGKH
ncbi:hypothetical protein F4815DRAFT_224355 [Daldinia loculata]|nr:hypothetical protein F4815DRAFT_224355 [Daldinia loculata]